MLELLAVLLCSPTPAPQAAGPAQESAPTPQTLPGSPEAQELWRRVCAASGPAERAEIQAFRLKAEVLTRSGVQTNEATIDYAYLAPDCIRFMTPSRGETGRYGKAQDQYWLREGDEVVVLAGREYVEDRRLVDSMLALARNYVALSNPARLNLLGLERLAAPPADVGESRLKAAGKLAWLALESPDFALVRRDDAPRAKALYRVELGVREDGLPALAIIREQGTAPGDPLLVQFDAYDRQDEFKLPHTLKIHVLDRNLSPVAFARDASQEVYVTAALLRPALKIEDFRP